MLSTAAQRWTFGFMVAVTAIVIIYDIVIYNYSGRPSTLSVVGRRMFTVYYSIFLAFVYWLGVLTGHLFPP